MKLRGLNYFCCLKSNFYFRSKTNSLYTRYDRNIANNNTLIVEESFAGAVCTRQIRK